MSSRLLVVYGRSLANDHIVSALEARSPGLVKVAESATPWDILRRTSRRRGDTLLSKLDKFLFYAFYAAVLARPVRGALIQRFGRSPAPTPDFETTEINGDATLAFVRRAEPDLILVSGTSILRGGWHALGAPMLNAHTGVMPRYRGRFCWFWPVVERRHCDVGVSVHVVTRGIDAGEVMVQKRVRLVQGEDCAIPSLLTSVTSLVVEAFDEAITRIEKGDRPEPDHTDAVEYPIYLEPGLSDYLTFWRRRRVGPDGAASGVI
jgi:folate-dependent phosphoribosylglycinamide formyltransferase PurN